MIGVVALYHYFWQNSTPLYVYVGSFNRVTNATEADIIDNILDNFNNKTVRMQVKANLAPKVKWETCLKWINWKIADSACPFRISRSSQPRIPRLPDAIGIGVAKAGTGSLAFLDCHPDIVFRAFEPDAYPSRKLLSTLTESELEEKRHGAHTYRSNCMGSHSDTYSMTIPLAAPDEFLIEKSPMYAQQRHCRSGEMESCTLTRARQLKLMKPDVKLFMFITDPIERIVSHLKMVRRNAVKNQPDSAIMQRTLQAGPHYKLRSPIFSTVELLSFFSQFDEKQASRTMPVKEPYK